jgi:hypothetical protein
MSPQKRQLELQEAEHQDRRLIRRREALNARYRATGRTLWILRAWGQPFHMMS